MTKTAPAATKRITLERTYTATLDELWALWTSKEGIESWWGPEGFRVEVRSLDLRVGGVLAYAMITEGPDQVAFMKQANMPLSSEHSLHYTEVVRNVRLAYLHAADFIPGVAPYEVATVVELHPQASTVRMVIHLDPMHDDIWTNRAVMGWESELGKLGKVLGQRG